MIKNIIIGIIFVLGLYYMTCMNTIEGFKTKQLNDRCPDVLIQKGSAFFLYNSKLANVPGVNPIRFSNLDEYVQFTDWQRSHGIRCPVLYLQHSYDIQGNSVYKARPSPENLKGGLPTRIVEGKKAASSVKLLDAHRSDPPYNTNSFPGHDPQMQNVGLDTPLDKMFHEPNYKVSPNPMDTTWGGQDHTQDLIDKGYYSNREVLKKK